LSLPYETLGFEELKRNCTDWPAEITNYSTCVTYHNFKYHPQSEVEQQRVEIGVLARHVEFRMDEPLHDLAVAGEVDPDGTSLNITVVTKARLFQEDKARQILEDISRVFQTLNSSL
jgi:hypothetical protein